MSADFPPSKPALSGPKRHHFLPRFYLEGFTEGGVLAVYDRIVNTVRVQNPVNTGVIGHFYTFEDADGRKRFEVEKMLSECEAKASIVIEKLSQQRDITDDDRADLAIFVALACFRTPDVIDSLKLFNSNLIRDIADRMFSRVAEVKERMRVTPGAPSDEDALHDEAQELVDFVRNGNCKVTTQHAWAIGTAMQTALKIAPILAGRNWIAIHRDTDKKSFVTCDAPVMLTTVAQPPGGFWGGIGFANPDAMVAFPMTQACALVMFGRDGAFQHRSVSAEQIRNFNMAIADRCQRFVIGKDAALVRSLSKALNLGNKEWQPKMRRTGS